MQFATMVVLAGIGFGSCTFAQAGGQAQAAEPGGWMEAQSLRELPAGIQALLGVGLGADGIADRDEDFNAGVAHADNMPACRFALGIVNGDTAVVAVEQGGRVYSVRAVEFRQDGATWDAVRCAWMTELPHRGAELAEAFARRARPCRNFGLRMYGPEVAPAPAATTIVQPRVRPRPGA